MKRFLLALLALWIAPALASQSTCIVLTPTVPPQRGQQATFIASYLQDGGHTTGVKPVWSVSGATATFIYADSTQTKVFISIPTAPTAFYVQVSVSAAIPETPPITVGETLTVVIP